MKIEKKLFYIWLVVSLILLNSCKEEDQKYDLLILSTKEVEIDGTTKNGIKLSASILLDSKETILEQGFVYGLHAEPSLQDLFLKVRDVSRSKFIIALEDALVPDTTYFVRSFVKTEKHLIYGNEVSFYSNGSEPPVIEKIEPELAFWGDTIMIIGKNFDHSGKNNTVYFNNFESSRTWGGLDTLFTIVPDELNVKTSEIKVSLYNQQSKNNKIFKIHSPVITNLSKTNGQYPDTITITGNYFSAKHASIEFGDKTIYSFISGKESLKFVVPFLGKEGILSVKMQQLEDELIISDKFNYNEQKILGISSDSIYVTDTITIYAQNIDFRRVDLISDIEGVRYDKLSVWQDSMQIRNLYYNHKKMDTKFLLTCQIPNYTTGELQTIHQQTIPRKKPRISKVHNPKLSYNGSLILDVEGYYSYWGNSGIIIIQEDGSEEEIASYDRRIEINDDQMTILIPETYYPGSYKFYVKSNGIVSDPVQFEVMMPKVTSLTSGVIRRGASLLLEGEYLPVESTAYQFRHTESNRAIPVKGGSNLQNFTYLRTWGLMGKGEYQLEFKFGEEFYPTGRSITLESYFEYVNTCDVFDIYEGKGQVCFANNGKLYYLIHYEAAMRVIDIETGAVDKIRTNILEESWYNDHKVFPTIVDGKVYIHHMHQLFEFEFETHQWIQISVDNVNDSIVRTANINHELVVTNTDNEVLKYNGAWEKIGQAKFDYFTFGIGDYYYTGFNKGFSKVSLSDFSNSVFIDSPLGRWDTYYSYRHLFVYKEELYEALNLNSILEIARFSPTKGTFSKLDPSFISSSNYYSRFFKDVNGDVFYLVNNEIYRFVADEKF